MATTVTKVIDPDMGSGYDYDSLFDWEAAQQGDLTGVRDEIAVAKCRCTGGTADTTAIVIDGWTTSATQYIKVWTDPSESYRHNGTYQTGNKYRLETSADYCMIYCVEADSKIIGLQIFNNYNSNSCAAIGIGGDGSDRITISHCVLKRGSFARSSDGITAYGGVQGFIAYNNIFYDWTPTDGSPCNGIRFGTVAWDNDSIIANNTFHNCRTGILIGSNKYVRIINNIFQSCAVAPMSSETCQAGSGYNATNAASLGYTVDGGATGDRVSQTFSFANEASDNFHLAPNDTSALGFGLNLYNDAAFPFQTDIDGQDRGGSGASWDIGADEYVSLGTTEGTVWGYQTPTGYTGESWTTWKTAAGGSAVVDGDANWGKLNLTSSNHYGPVKDTGNSRGKRFVLKRDSIGTGSGTVNFFIRGSITSFAAADGSPSWEAYSVPVNRTWRYVQAKAEKV